MNTLHTLSPLHTGFTAATRLMKIGVLPIDSAAPRRADCTRMNGKTTMSSSLYQRCRKWICGMGLTLLLASCADMQNTGGLKGDRIPNVQGIYQGSYSYGSSYEKLTGQAMNFEIALQQARGSNKIKGVIKEAYTGFGTMKNGYLWADIVGTCEEENGYVHLKFTKTYRYFKHPSVSYSGSLPPGSTLLTGTWFFPDKTSDSGMFQISNLHIQ